MGHGGTVALVTGAGIGRAIALRFAREDAAAADVDSERAQETARLIEAEAGLGSPLSVDEAVENEARGMFGFAEQRFGGLDVPVNNAVGAPGPHLPYAPSDH